MDGNVIGLALGLIATIITSGSAIWVAHQYQKKGGGDAQLKVNSTYKELTAVLGASLSLREGELKQCLDKVNTFLVDAEAQAKEQTKKELEWDREKSRWRRERLNLKQEIDDLRDQVRELRREVKANAS